MSPQKGTIMPSVALLVAGDNKSQAATAAFQKYQVHAIPDLRPVAGPATVEYRVPLPLNSEEGMSALHQAWKEQKPGKWPRVFDPVLNHIESPQQLEQTRKVWDPAKLWVVVVTFALKR